MTSRQLLMAVVVIALALGLGVWASQGGDEFDMSSSAWLLYPVQDESSVETTIARYIKQKMNIKADVKFLDDDMSDLAIYYPILPRDAPHLQVRIDTMSARKKADRIVERVIILKAYYVMPDAAKTPETRQKILEASNEYMLKYWIPDRIILDRNGDIVIQTLINIADKNAPIHCEAVVDGLTRMLGGWSSYYEMLDEAIGLSTMK